MALQLGSTGGRLAAVCVYLGSTAGCIGILSGCVGSGDDSGVHVLPGDGGDATAGDARDGGARSSDAPPADAPDATFEGGDASNNPIDATLQDTGDAAAAGPPSALLSASAIEFGAVGCGAMPVTKTLTITNTGASPLAVSASKVGSAFTLSPTSLILPHGMSGTLTLTATIPSSATAGTPITGSLALFTNDPSNNSIVMRVSATPTGATLTGMTQYSFASTEVGIPAPPVTFTVTNSGNAAAMFTFAAPSDPSVTFGAQGDGGAIMIPPGATFSETALFTPASTTQTITARSSISASGVCGTSLSSIAFTGVGAAGHITVLPSNTVDFGPANCGGLAPPAKTIVLTNSGAIDAMLTRVDKANSGPFTTDAETKVGTRISAYGGTMTITLNAPAVPAATAGTPVPLGQMIKTLVLHTDADPSTQGTTITLTEQPQGAILAFGSPTTPNCTTAANFGSFSPPSFLLLQSSPPQNFCVINTGNAAANVRLTAAENADAGAAPSDGGADAAMDATLGSILPTPFSLLVPTFTIPPMPTSSTNPSVQQDSVAFQPVHANATNGALAMSVDTTSLCGALPSGISLSGNAIGGGPVVTPTSLTFQAICGGAAPGAQTFVVSNAGTVNLGWTMSSVSGPGAGQYAVTANPPPGMLIPGATSTVTVTAAKIPSPAPNPTPAALAAQISISTDVPNDPLHIVTLSEVPLGGQLSVAVGDPSGTLRFGQVPIGTSISRSFTVTNAANPGSPTANVPLMVTGAGVTAYSAPQLTAGDLAPGDSASYNVTFQAPGAGPYPGTIAFTSSDALCTSLPSPIVLSGTGTAGAVSVSPTTLAFGAAGDPNGLVNCGSTGTPQTLTLSNVGNQTFHVTAATFAKGVNSPFTLSAITLPLTLVIGGSTTLTVTPSIIPGIVGDPNDPNAFSDVLTITTDAAGDTFHTIPLAMQPRGALIANTPVTPGWSFGTIGAGSIGTFTTTIQNLGNLQATVALKKQSLPGVFGLQNNPTTVPPNSVVELVGRFAPPSSNGTWTDQGQLVVSAAAFCQTIPSQWITPNVNLTGASNDKPIVMISGSLVFPSTGCGGAPPGGQSVTLTNATNLPYAYSSTLVFGTRYTLTDSNAGSLAPNGIATIVVNPKPVTPGPGVLPGSAPYADDLLIGVATAPVTNFTVAISWTLNGAVLSLPQGAGPYADSPGIFFYLADSTSGFALPMGNAGTATAGVDLAIQPSSSFVLQPSPPIQVLPNIAALPQLVGAAPSPACPATSNGTATFVYSGPVCQPFPLASISVHSCTGTHQ